MNSEIIVGVAGKGIFDLSPGATIRPYLGESDVKLSHPSINGLSIYGELRGAASGSCEAHEHQRCKVLVVVSKNCYGSQCLPLEPFL